MTLDYEFASPAGGCLSSRPTPRLTMSLELFLPDLLTELWMLRLGLSRSSSETEMLSLIGGWIGRSLLAPLCSPETSSDTLSDC